MMNHTSSDVFFTYIMTVVLPISFMAYRKLLQLASVCIKQVVYLLKRDKRICGTKFVNHFYTD